MDQVARLALGTVQFGIPYGIANKLGQVSQASAKLILELASVSAIDTIDTAIAYGESESCLGKVGIKGFRLVTKLPPIPNDCFDLKTWVYEQVDASLHRMGVETIYGLLLHRSEELMGNNRKGLYKVLQGLKSDGRVEKIGISIYSPSELDTLMSYYHFDLVQAPLSLVDQRILKTGWLSRLKDKGVEVHTRSTFLQGLLLLDYIDIPSKFSHWDWLFQKWHLWLKAHNFSALEASLAFSLSFPEIDRVVVGVDSPRQLEQIIKAANLINIEFPNLNSEDENLINPANWSSL